MPKAKPDSLQSIRFELQDHERELIDMVGASMAFRNVGQGVGAILDPILDNLAAIVAIIIAHEGIEWLIDAIDRADERAQEGEEETATVLYENYVTEWTTLYGPEGTARDSDSYANYAQNWTDRYGEGTSERRRLGHLNIPPLQTEEQYLNIPPLLSEAQWIEQLNAGGEFFPGDSWTQYVPLQPGTSLNPFGRPISESGYSRARWWQNNVGNPMRSAGRGILSSFKLW